MADTHDIQNTEPPCPKRPSLEAAMGVFSIALGCVGLLSVLSFIYWDLNLTLWAAKRPPWLHKILDALTNLGDSAVWLVPMGVLAAFFFFVKKQRQTAMIWLTAFLAVAITGIVANLIKLMIGRYRPKAYFRDDLFGFNPMSYGYAVNSMPSGHSTTCGAMLVILWLYFPRWRWLSAAAAVFIASTRIWVTAHYLSDVLTGLLVGTTGTFAIYYIAVGAGWVAAPPGWRKRLAS